MQRLEHNVIVERPAMRRRIIDGDLSVEPTAVTRQPVGIPYQTNTVLFGGWGVKL